MPSKDRPLNHCPHLELDLDYLIVRRMGGGTTAGCKREWARHIVPDLAFTYLMKTMSKVRKA